MEHGQRLSGLCTFLLLAIVVLSLSGCNSNPSLPGHGLLAFVAVTGDGKTRTSQVYLFDPADWRLRLIGNGNAVQWSSSSSYLAVFEASEDPEWMGLLYSFSVWDLETFGHNEQEYHYGNRFLWSPDEKYIVTGWGVRHGCWGIDIWVGDASKLVYSPGYGYCAQGYNIGYIPLQWEDNQLLVKYYPFAGSIAPDGSIGRSGVYTLSPENGGWEFVRESISHGEASVVLESRTWWTEAQDVLSTDKALRAVVQGNALFVVAEQRAYEVPLPENVVGVPRMAWSP